MKTILLIKILPKAFIYQNQEEGPTEAMSRKDEEVLISHIASPTP